MSLTDKAIRNAKPRDRAYKLADGGGLYLYVTPAGGRLWRMKYRSDGLERKLSFGKYPDVTLSDARKARDAARSVASSGIDPSAVKRRERVAKRLSAGITFSAIASEYIAKAEKEGRSSATIVKLRWSQDWLETPLGRRPIDHIEPHELLSVLRAQEKA